MSIFYIKSYFRFLCFTYICFKIINFKISNTKQKIILCVFPLLLTTVSYLLTLYIDKLAYIVPLLLLWTLTSYLTQQPQAAFIASILSFGLSYGIFAMSCIISLIIHFPFFPNKESFPYYMHFLFAGILSLFTSIRVFKISRFKRGMPFIFSNRHINNATIVCLIVLMVLIYRFFNIPNLIIRVITPAVLVLTFYLLIHWWQTQITKSYNQSVMIRNYESLTGELEEAYKKISTLEAQNEDQGRLIHHDNKRIAAMENAICEYLLSDFSDVESTKDRGRTLYLEIQSLSRNRSDTLKEIYEKKSRHYSTRIGSLDTLLNYMDKRATEDNIEFTVHNAVELENYIPKQISTEDLTHVLSDLLENAIIASKGTTNPVIQLQFYVSEKHFVIEVADSGIPFEAKSIVNFGLSRLTTHEATGGSGIGLMDIWNIKEKYGATLHIEEYETPSPFSKKISLVFNHKNLYSLKTYRTDEITALSKRHDLRIY